MSLPLSSGQSMMRTFGWKDELPIRSIFFPQTQKKKKTHFPQISPSLVKAQKKPFYYFHQISAWPDALHSDTNYTPNRKRPFVWGR
jgi:hypothetical protein